MEQKILVINSKDRNNYDSTNSNCFRITLSAPLFSDKKKVKCNLTAVSIPKAGFNINNNNNTAQIDVQNVAVENIVIPVGYYTISSLCTAFQNAVNSMLSGFGVFTVTYTSSSQTITISVSPTSTNFRFYDSELIKQLGFYLNTGVGYASSWTSNGSIQFLTEPLYLYLTINQLSSNVYDSTNDIMSTFLIPLLNTTPQTIDLESNLYLKDNELKHINPEYTIFDPRFNYLDIKLQDAGQNPINLNYADWFMVLRFEQFM